MTTLRAFRSLFIIVLALHSIGCRSGPIEGWSSRARTMILTSDPSEIVLSSSRVPGYWAQEAGSGQEFFLYTSVRSHKKGNRVKVEGPFGSAYPAVFRNETGDYLRGSPTLVLVVWKIERSGDQEAEKEKAMEATVRAPRP
jgi:hypothetical protein